MVKFGGTTTKSIAKAHMRSLKQQFVFDNNQKVNRPRNELVVHLRGHLHPLGASTLVQDYYRGVSNEKQAGMGKGFPPVFKHEYKLNEAELQDLVQESVSHINPESEYAELRWHDVVVLLLIVQLFEPDNDLGKYARFHLSALMQLNPEIAKCIEKCFLQ